MSRLPLADSATASRPVSGVLSAADHERIAHVALNVLTNYFNKAVDVEVDFPVIAA